MNRPARRLFGAVVSTAGTTQFPHGAREEISGRSAGVIPSSRLLAEGLRLDFALVDGWHSFDQVMMEVYFLNRMLAPGALLVFDDVHLPALQRVLAFVASLPAYRPLPLSEARRKTRAARVRRLMGVPEYRLAGMLKVAEDERDWDHWVDF